MRFLPSVVLVCALAGTAETAEIDPAVYAPMTRKGYPKTFAMWGDEGVKRIDDYTKRAAFAVAKSPSCDEVIWASLSDNKSSPPDKIVIFVDCQNGYRAYLTAQELDKNPG